MTSEEHNQLVNILEGNAWETRTRLLDFVNKTNFVEETEVKPKQRTLTQNSALHLFFSLVAETLNDAGLDMKKTLKPEIDIDWTPESVKNYLWRPVQKAMLGKESTTELTKLEVGQVYETLNRFLGEKFAVHVPWPHDPDKENQLIKAMDMAANAPYPEYIEPTL
jgi:hypothetical protein